MVFEIEYHPHNDLENLARYHLEILNEKTRTSNLEGIALDCMSCLIAIAFCAEALINFLGKKKVPEWKERDPLKNKVTVLLRTLAIQPSEADKFKSTFRQLQNIRNLMAHGKPSRTLSDSDSPTDFASNIANPWDSYLRASFCNTIFGDLMNHKAQLFQLSEISLGESLTNGIASFRLSR